MAGCRAFTDEEMGQVSKALPTPRDKMLFLMGCKTGFRISELLSLTVGDVLEHDGSVTERLYVARGNMKGGKKAREIKLNHEVREALTYYIRSIGLDPIKPLFGSRKGPITQAISKEHAYAVLSSVCRLLGLSGRIGTHSMRKTFARKMYEALDRDIYATSRALGHASITTTVKYLDLVEERLDEAIERI